MNQSDLWLSLSLEARALYDSFSGLQLLVPFGVFALSGAVGRFARLGSDWLVELNLDRRRRLARLGTILQPLIALFIALALLSRGFEVAPGVTLLVCLTAVPTLGLLLHGQIQNALAGVSLVLAGTLQEGDDILLEDGRSGRLTRLRLTTTVARTAGGAELVIPNMHLVARPIQKQKEQPGFELKLSVPAARRPTADDIARAQALLHFSPYRARASAVSVRVSDDGQALELSLRVLGEPAVLAATREIQHKLPRALRWPLPPDADHSAPPSR